MRQIRSWALMGAVLGASLLGNVALADDNRRISVSGEGIVAQAPDMVRLSVGVLAEAPEAADAMAQMSENLTKVLSAIEALGVAKADIQTSHFSLWPRYTYPEGGEPIFTGFTAASDLNLRLRDVAAMPSVVDAVVSQGGSTIGNIAFEVQNPQEALNAARKAAVEDARAKAELYAAAAGVGLGELISLQESYSRSEQAPMARMAAADVNVPIEAGEVSVTATVQIVYGIAD